MQYLTLEKESGAIQTVNMGPIGEEVNIREKLSRPQVGCRETVRKLEYRHLALVASGLWKIRIPKPTIEDLRVGDIFQCSQIMPNGKLKINVHKIWNENDLSDLRELNKKGKILVVKLITRKSEGVVVLEGE